MTNADWDYCFRSYQMIAVACVSFLLPPIKITFTDSLTQIKIFRFAELALTLYNTRRIFPLTISIFLIFNRYEQTFHATLMFLFMTWQQYPRSEPGCRTNPGSGSADRHFNTHGQTWGSILTLPALLSNQGGTVTESHALGRAALLRRIATEPPRKYASRGVSSSFKYIYICYKYIY